VAALIDIIMSRRRCFYVVLGVARDATDLDIKVAYRKAALQVILPILVRHLCDGGQLARCSVSNG